MILLAGLAAGFVVGTLVLALLAPAFESPVFTRTNYRGASLPTAVGLVVAVTVVLVDAAFAVVHAAGVADLDATAEARLLTLAAVVGFALLGAVDDLAGSGLDGRGFRGHLRALAGGRLTTGGLKLGGGVALAVVVCAHRSDGLGALVVDAALVALAANLGNLFDRAPGRTTKVAVVAAVVLVVVTAFDAELVGVAVAVGATVALFVDDLGERLMLGDTGANAVGAALGLGVVLTSPFPVRVVVLGALVALNAVSEVASFSRIIDQVPALRVIDRLGRRSPEPPG